MWFLKKWHFSYAIHLWKIISGKFVFLENRVGFRFKPLRDNLIRETLWLREAKQKWYPKFSMTHPESCLIPIRQNLKENFTLIIFFFILRYGLEWDSITLFTKMNCFFLPKNSHFNIICTRYIWSFIY